MPTPLEELLKKDPYAKHHQSMVSNNLLTYLINRYIMERQLRGEDINKSKENRRLWINQMVDDGFITRAQGDGLLRMHGDM